MKRICVLFALIAALLAAAAPAGRITSSGALTVNGTPVPAAAVASLPLVAGDEIATSSSAAVIVFADRTRAVIEPNSRVKLEANGASVRARLLSGPAGGLPSSLQSAARIGAAAATKRSKTCPPPPNDDPRDRNCGKGNDGKLP
jgi:hypothetical protein